MCCYVARHPPITEERLPALWDRTDTHTDCYVEDCTGVHAQVTHSVCDVTIEPSPIYLPFPVVIIFVGIHLLSGAHVVQALPAEKPAAARQKAGVTGVVPSLCPYWSTAQTAAVVSDGGHVGACFHNIRPVRSLVTCITASERHLHAGNHCRSGNEWLLW